jgi:hypothetical protein
MNAGGLLLFGAMATAFFVNVALTSHNLAWAAQCALMTLIFVGAAIVLAIEGRK